MVTKPYPLKMNAMWVVRSRDLGLPMAFNTAHTPFAQSSALEAILKWPN